MSDATTPQFLDLQKALAGRYSLERELGRGGMGVVYLAHEVRLDRPVALKLLPPEYAAQTSLRERFLSEARTAAKLSHPHIVPIHAVDEVGDFVFFVMSYIEGETLGERIRSRGPVSAKDAARILREVSWALAYAHAQGVVHRDVKPDNILLERESGRALVTDFGIAHMTDGSGGTSVGEVLGTAEYMSPEQAAGDPVDARTDMYSLGIVGHFMLTGRLPFQGDTVAATLAKQLTQPAPALTSVAPEVPAHLGQAIDRCLAKEPAERFAGCEDLADALASALPARKEIAGPIRAFAEKSRGQSGPFRAIGSLLVIQAVISTAFFEPGTPPEVMVVWALIALGVASVPPTMLVHMSRRLLRSGYGYEDLLHGLRNDLQQRTEDHAATYGTERTWLDRLASGMGYLGLGAVVAAFVGFSLAGWDLSSPLAQAAVLAVIAAMGLTIPAAAIAAFRHELRGRVTGGRWVKFWESRLGRWIFKAAGIGLDRLPAAGAAFRPTEMAIGLAADRLYEALPKDVRKQFKELPDVVRTLEKDADKIRARLKELDALASQVETGDEAGSSGRLASATGVTGKRDDLAGDLRAAREAADARLSEVVAALETIRLELLRLHSGGGSVEGMTADLGAARELSQDVRYLLQGRREVDELLGIPEPRGALDTPSPTPA